MHPLARTVCVGMILVLPGLGGEAVAATTIGNTSVVVRTVTGTAEGEKRYLNFEDDVYRNELIETFNESATEITFLDETVLSLGANTRVTLDRFVYDPDPDASSFVLSVTEGALRFTSGVLPSDSYEIHTPVATIGIRGTIVDIRVERARGVDGAPLTSVSLSVVEGEADFVDCRGRHTHVAEGLSSRIEGGAEGCSTAVAPGPGPAKVTRALRTRDELLRQ